MDGDEINGLAALDAAANDLAEKKNPPWLGEGARGEDDYANSQRATGVAGLSTALPSSLAPPFLSTIYEERGPDPSLAGGQLLDAYGSGLRESDDGGATSESDYGPYASVIELTEDNYWIAQLAIIRAETLEQAARAHLANAAAECQTQAHRSREKMQ